MGVENPSGIGPDHPLRESIDNERQELRGLIDSLLAKSEPEFEKKINDPKFRRTVGKLISEPFVKEDWPEKLD